MNRLFWLTVFVTFLADRFTKLLAQKFLVKPVEVIPNFFSLILAENKGAAFSIFSSSTGIVRYLFLIFLPILVVVGILYYLSKRGEALSKLEIFSFGLIVGGALGNLWDRVLNGKVVDFLDFHFYSYHYPTFNFADVAVFLGCFFLILRGMQKN